MVDRVKLVNLKFRNCVGSLKVKLFRWQANILEYVMVIRVKE